MTTPTPPSPGPPGADLENLLRDALRHGSQAPVDAERLVRGARVGAARIRRRRSVATTVAAVVLIAVPVGVIGDRLLGDQARTGDSTSSAAAGPAAEDSRVASGEGSDGGSGAGVRSPSPALAAVSGGPEGAGASLGPTGPAGPVSIPSAALLTGSDLPAARLSLSTDTRNGTPAAATPPEATCGRSLSGPPAAPVGSRAVGWERREGARSTWWLLGSTVRVYRGTGARTYLTSAAALPCASRTTGGDGAVITPARVDGWGRSEYYAVVRSGRVVSELRLVVPAGGAAGPADLLRLVSVAAGRLASSGLASAVASDPALG